MMNHKVLVDFYLKISCKSIFIINFQMFKISSLILAVTFGLISAHEVDLSTSRNLQGTFTKCLGCVLNNFIWSGSACSSTNSSASSRNANECFKNNHYLPSSEYIILELADSDDMIPRSLNAGTSQT